MAPSIRLATAADVPMILAISNEAVTARVANLANQPEPLSDWMASFDATNTTHPWLPHRFILGSLWSRSFVYPIVM